MRAKEEVRQKGGEGEGGKGEGAEVSLLFLLSDRSEHGNNSVRTSQSLVGVMKQKSLSVSSTTLLPKKMSGINVFTGLCLEHELRFRKPS